MCCLLLRECGVVVSAAALINNACGFKYSMARFQDKPVQTGGWATVCDSIREFRQGCNYFNSSQKLTNKNDQMSHVQHVTKNSGKICFGKLIFNDKMPLLAKYPRPTYI